MVPLSFVFRHSHSLAIFLLLLRWFSEGTLFVTKSLELRNLLGLCLRLLRLLLLLLLLLELHILHVFETCGRCPHKLRLASDLLLRLSCSELLCKLHRPDATSDIWITTNLRNHIWHGRVLFQRHELQVGP